MDFQRRTLLAIVVCVLIWLVYERFFAPPLPLPGAETAAVSAKAEDEQRAAAEERAAEERAAAAAPSAPAMTHRVATDLVALDVTNVGGLVTGSELLSPHFRNADGKGEDFLQLGGKKSLAVSFDANETDFRLPRNAAWEVLEPKSDQKWSLKYKDDEVEVFNTLEMASGYEGTLTVKVINRSAKPQSHKLVLRNMLGLGVENSYDIHRGVCATSDDVEDFDRSDVAEQTGVIRGQIRWGALDTKYFASAVVPEQPVVSCEVGLTDDALAMVNTLGASAATLEPNEARSYRFGLYFGTKELEPLKNFAAVAGVSLVDVIDWGFFGGLNRVLGGWMLWLLRVFYNLTGIWGVAIILLTIVVKLLTLPLTFKQMRSMKKMREIQPELEALKRKYADDKMRQAQEMQELFRRAQINPLAGCLPMLIQLPIWIALYATLNSAVELYRVPFLWLPDLTQQDPYYILPLAMGALMYLQMKIQPSGVDNEQAKMMAWMMPIVFTVMMLFLPSGLGVYIFANVLLSLIQTVIQLRPSQQTAAPAKS